MNILLLDGGKDFEHSNGDLNHALNNTVQEILPQRGHNIQETAINNGYDI